MRLRLLALALAIASIAAGAWLLLPAAGLIVLGTLIAPLALYDNVDDKSRPRR